MSTTTTTTLAETAFPIPLSTIIVGRNEPGDAGADACNTSFNTSAIRRHRGGGLWAVDANSGGCGCSDSGSTSEGGPGCIG